MMSRLIDEAMAVLGINPSVYTATTRDWERIQMYLRQHASGPVSLAGDVYLHNDVPFVEGCETWQTMTDLLVFRGSKRAYNDLGHQGFKPVQDDRFPYPVIIRDSWRERGVTTRMQTKSVLAWSKSFKTALEYAQGCISGGGLLAYQSGFLHFCMPSEGLDVEGTVRAWESHTTRLNGTIDLGTQLEVLTPPISRQKILATWELTRGPHFGPFDFRLVAMTVHEGANFAAVMPTYERIAAQFAIGPIYDAGIAGKTIDQTVLFV